jgi:glycosyltransferase involved in cell wall biosynthesis
MTVTVAIPVRNGAATLDGVLRAVLEQQLDEEVEVVVCDSGSRDGSQAIARRHGARLIEIAPESFAHGPTRNLLVREARGEHVALLTQDAQPADEQWLARLLGGFTVAEDVAIVCGSYRPRPGASPQTAHELERWFASLAPDGGTRVDRLELTERSRPARELFGRRTFFTDANACLRRSIWEKIPFRDVAYAEDQALALDVLRAGYAKAFVPDAAVWHSHDYTALQQFRRAFDEWRGLLEIYDWRQSAAPREILRSLRGELGLQRRDLVAAGASPSRQLLTLAAVGRHHMIRLAGALLGSRADRLAPGVRGWCSLEGRTSLTVADEHHDDPSSRSRRMR